MVEKTDVCIVGAGPAGSTAAKFLSEKGLNVILIDKEKFPRDKPCGGGLPYQVIKRFDYVDNEIFIDSYCYGGFAISPSSKYKLELHKKEPLVAMTLRKKFDYELVKLAINEGTEFLDGKTVIDVNISKDKATVVLKDGSRVDSDIVIGADGIWSVIAQKAGLRKKGISIGICVFEEYEVDEKTMDTYFGSRRLGYIHSQFNFTPGYGWVFPKKKHINIGIGYVHYSEQKTPDRKNLLDIYNQYITILKRDGMIPKRLKTGKCQGGALPVYPLEKTYSNRVILVGDAAGFINPLSGEGIYYAMVSGEIAANTIAKCYEKNDFSDRFLSKYQKSWKKDFGKDIKTFKGFSKYYKATEDETIFRLASKDQKLTELLAGILIGQISINENKWKILRRFLCAYIKNRIKKS